jgi:hypothetical protein
MNLEPVPVRSLDSYSACGAVEVRGSSTKTFFPFSRRALAISKYVRTGVTAAIEAAGLGGVRL